MTNGPRHSRGTDDRANEERTGHGGAVAQTTGRTRGAAATVEGRLAVARLCRGGGLEGEGGGEAVGVVVEGGGCDGDVDVVHEGAGEDEGGAHTDGGTAQDVPPVVAVGVYASPCDVTRHDSCGYAPLPAIAFPQEGGAVCGDCRVGAGEGVMACAVGTVFLDAQLQAVIHC